MSWLVTIGMVCILLTSGTFGTKGKFTLQLFFTDLNFLQTPSLEREEFPTTCQGYGIHFCPAHLEVT